MHKKINNSARISNMSTNKKLKISAISSSNVAAEPFPELPHQTDTSDSDEESVSEILLACLCLRPDLLVDSFPLEQASTEELPDSCSDSCEVDENDVDEDEDDEDDNNANNINNPAYNNNNNQNNNDDDEEDEDEDEDEDDEDEENDPDDDDDEDDEDPDDDDDEDEDEDDEDYDDNEDNEDDEYDDEDEDIHSASLVANCIKSDKVPVLKNASLALDEAAQALTRMRSDSNSRDKNILSRNLIAACTDNDVNAVRRLLIEGNTLNDTTDDGDSLLSLACSAGYYELAQVLLAMSAQVEDRGQKNDCTPLMEAASAGHIDIIELLIRHGADVNAQSSTGNTPLMYACAGGHVSAVKSLLAHGANVEDHNENGHTPLMEAASAGHVEVAKILLEHGAGINTHSNEFKESALTLACYKGHLDMVRFLLQAGADQEHKTDEMHTALMEASMDGHVEVARLLLDSGAQVNMPTDSFESPLTLAACGGHVDLAMLLIERGANIEEVNDEGYTPLMEAAREGHEEMVSLLLTQGANINAQTEETQETALTLACCGGFLDVADYLIKHGADIELGASTPLMEAAQEGHLDLVKFLLESKADVHAQTQTGDTALTYACENGHTDVAEVLLYYGAELEHESEGGRTPLMKACRAGHICTIKFLIQKGADVNRQTTNNDHTPLSLACAGGHQQVVDLLLNHGADPYHKLKDNSTMLIEAAKGGHTSVVQLLLDFPTKIADAMQQQQPQQLNLLRQQQHNLKQQQQQQQQQPAMQQRSGQTVNSASSDYAAIHEVSEVIRLADPPGASTSTITTATNNRNNYKTSPPTVSRNIISNEGATNNNNSKQKNLLRKNRQATSPSDFNLTPSSDPHQVRSQPIGEDESSFMMRACMVDESMQQKMDNTLQKNIQFINDSGPPPTLLPYAATTPGKIGNLIPSNLTAGMPTIQQYTISNNTNLVNQQTIGTKFNNLPSTTLPTAPSEVSQSTAISDRPKAKPVSKKEGKNARKMLLQQQQLQQMQSQNIASSEPSSYDIPLCENEQNQKNDTQMAKVADELMNQQQQQHEIVLNKTIDGDKDKISNLESNRNQVLIDFETYQKTRMSYLSRNSVIEKIVKLIDTPKSPPESPTDPDDSSPSCSKMMSEITELSQLLDAFPDLMSVRHTNDSNIQSKIVNQFEHLKKEQNASNQVKPLSVENNIQVQLVVNNEEEAAGGAECNLYHPTLEETLDSFQLESHDNLDIDTRDSVHANYEWVEEFSQLFQEFAANINTQDIESYANLFGLNTFNSICKSKWTTPQWPAPTHFQQSMPDMQMSEQIIPDENLQISLSSYQGNEEGMMDDKQRSQIPQQQNLMMSLESQPIHSQQLPLERLRLITQFQQQSTLPLISSAIDQQQASNILLPALAATTLNNQSGHLSQSPNISDASSDPQKADTLDSQQTKFVFNVETDQNSQSVQLMFQLPSSIQDQTQFQQVKHPQKIQNNIQQQQQQQPMQDPQQLLQEHEQLSHQVQQENQMQSQMMQPQSLLNFQLSNQHQIMKQQTVPQKITQQQQIALQKQVQQSHNQAQVLPHQQLPQFCHKNYSHVQVATQTQQTQPIIVPLDHQQQQEQQLELQKAQQEQLQNTEHSQHQKHLQLQQKQQQVRQQQQQHQKQQLCQQQNQKQLLQQQQQQQHVENTVNVPSTSTKLKGITSCNGKKSISDKLIRKDKARYGLRQSPNGHTGYQYCDQTNGIQPQYSGAIPGSTSTGTTTAPGFGPDRMIDVDSETDSNHDTALTLACAGGHEELVELLIKRGANIEHRDKKGFTPLILAATAGHEKVVETLINCNADLEAQSERTKDTPLSLACSGGRYEVVEMLLKVGANKEHRNVSDYTPLSLAASGGYVNIIKLLLQHGAEINSRTGSKLGISPLMLAAMNGHTAAVRLLLDMGSDINAQIETNRNTALTLACFQGRHEVVSLLLDRKANVEHRAKTGLTPLMEAASGGYIEVGRVLLDKGADVNAAPVPSSRDTALTIAADKGHLKFVELLLSRGAAVEVKNKKGNSPLWLAANGGHLAVVEALYNAGSDIDSQDNRKVSCLMAAFRKGHAKVVKWMVNHVSQFPSDQEMTRYISVVEKEVIDKCHDCVKIIRAAKETQATKANINASILLKELDMERSREESRKAAAAKRREKKKRRKQEKREAQRMLHKDDVGPNKDGSKGKRKQKTSNDDPDDDSDDSDNNDEDDGDEGENVLRPLGDKEEGDSGIDANSQDSCASSEVKPRVPSNDITIKDNDRITKKKSNKKKQQNQPRPTSSTINQPNSIVKNNRLSNSPNSESLQVISNQKPSDDSTSIRKVEPSVGVTRKLNKSSHEKEKENMVPVVASTSSTCLPHYQKNIKKSEYFNQKASNDVVINGSSDAAASTVPDNKKSKTLYDTTASHANDRLPDVDADHSHKRQNRSHYDDDKTSSVPMKPTHVSGKREEGWKEVGRKYSMQAGIQSGSIPVQQQVQGQQSQQQLSSSSTTIPEIGCKKIQVPVNAISRVIGRGGSNINAIRAATGAHIEVEKQGKTQGDRSITIKGVAEATKQAHLLISALVKDPEADILSMLPRNNMPPASKLPQVSSVTTVSTPVSVFEKPANTIPKAATTTTSSASFASLTSTAPATVKTPFGGTPSKSTTSSLGKSSIQPAIKTGKPVAAKSLHPLLKAAGATNNQNKVMVNDGSNKLNLANNSPLSSKNLIKSPPTSFGNSSSSTTNTNIDKLNNVIKHAPTFVVITTASNSGQSNPKFSNAFDRKAEGAMTSTTSISYPSSVLNMSQNEARSNNYQSPTKTGAIGSLPSPFKNDGTTSFRNASNSKPNVSGSKSKLGESDVIPASSSSASTVTTNVRSVTPIGPPTRNMTTLPPSNIVNVLDLSTSNRNQIPNQDLAILQAKFNELTMNSKANHEYQLFNDNYIGKWSQAKTLNMFNQLKINPLEMEPPVQVDASKAPGYRGSGGNSMNSPVSSISSTNSATSPSNILAQPMNQGGNNNNSKLQSQQLKSNQPQAQKSQSVPSKSAIQTQQQTLHSRSQMPSQVISKPPIDQHQKKKQDEKQEQHQIQQLDMQHQEKKHLQEQHSNEKQHQMKQEKENQMQLSHDQQKEQQQLQDQEQHQQEHQQHQQHQQQQKHQQQPFGQSISSYVEPELMSDMIKPIGPGNPNQRSGMNIGGQQSTNRDNMNQFVRVFDPISNSSMPQNMMQYGGVVDPISPPQPFGVPPQNPAMSRLNPKATSFLTNNNQSKITSQPQQQNQFGGNYHQTNNNMNVIKPNLGMPHPPFYSPPTSSASGGRQTHQNQQTLQTAAARSLYSDFNPTHDSMDQCLINLGSPTISTSGVQQNAMQPTPPLSGSLPSTSHQQNPIQEDRKIIPRPIGTERNSVNKNWMYPYSSTSNVGMDLDMAGVSSVQQPWFDKNVQQWNHPGPYPPFEQPPIDRNYQDFFPYSMDYSNPPNVNYMPSIPSYRPFMTGNGDMNTNEQQPWEQQEKYNWSATKWSH